MLLGRSAANGTSNSFGWRSQTGSIDDMNSPYSLGLVDFPFTEMLVTNAAGDRAYIVTAPSNFWSDCQTAGCGTAVSVEAGMCNNVTMLNFTGYNSDTDRFFFRDLAEFVFVEWVIQPFVIFSCDDVKIIEA